MKQEHWLVGGNLQQRLEDGYIGVIPLGLSFHMFKMFHNKKNLNEILE